MLRSGTKEQAPLDENVSSEWMKNGKISVDYRVKKLRLQFISASEYLQACMIPKDHHASVLFTAADGEYLSFVVCTVATLSDLFSFQLNAQNSELAAIAE